MKKPSILCVDDEPFVLSALKRVMRREGYTVLTAASAPDGLALMEGEEVELVLSDQRMPEMTGIEFLQQVKARFPDTVRVILSGYVDVGVMVDAINQGEIYRFLTKPWNDDELRAAVRQCLEHHAIVRQNRELLAQIQEQNETLREMNRRLEETVEERTRSLLLARDVVGRIPTPVIEVNGDGTVGLANRAARAVTPPLAGTAAALDLRTVLPPDVARGVDDVLHGLTDLKRMNCTWFGREVCLRILPVREGEPTLGCVLALSGLNVCNLASAGGDCEACRYASTVATGASS
jgi:two-component system NtrC family sensor kinase